MLNTERHSRLMIDFENKEYLKLKESDNDEYADLINGILVSGESIIHTYKSVRDGLVFTNRRLIAINIQGITGKKKTITILPYDRVQAFSVETAGVIAEHMAVRQKAGLFDVSHMAELLLEGSLGPGDTLAVSLSGDSLELRRTV